MPASKAQQKAVSKYMKNNYDTVTLRIRKDGEINKAVITENANKANESVNEYVLNSVKRRIESGE